MLRATYLLSQWKTPTTDKLIENSLSFSDVEENTGRNRLKKITGKQNKSRI